MSLNKKSLSEKMWRLFWFMIFIPLYPLIMFCAMSEIDPWGVDPIKDMWRKIWSKHRSIE